MIKDQCISVTDLRINPKKCLKDLEKHEKYLFINGRPKAAIVDLDEFERMKKVFDEMPVLYEMSKDEISPELRKLADKTRKMDSSEFVNI
ncbi:hypothetical protein A2335_04925 [Candidatus Peregrinibacteria bacterium RIFOXYB2_FULL_32_7]|nr:MAG: hypothetical protein A2335_04925 [Candidatus Peregrinibacteria bacterium RIFOXYB2_FULL_32_7]